MAAPDRTAGGDAAEQLRARLPQIRWYHTQELAPGVVTEGMFDLRPYVDDYGLPWVAAFLTLYAGLTMVSNVPFYSFKDINLRRSVPFAVILLVVLGFVLISTDPPIVLFLLFVAYGLSGYVYWLWKRRRPGEPARLQ